MILTEEKRQEFNQLVRPLVKWLNDTCHPHVEITITPSSASLKEGVCYTPINDFIKD